jgi:resuscitation-promoting factor RpfB
MSDPSMPQRKASVDIRRKNTWKKTLHRQLPTIIALILVAVLCFWAGKAYANQPTKSKVSLRSTKQVNQRPYREDFISSTTTTTTTTSTTVPRVVKYSAPSPAPTPVVSQVGDEIYLKLAACESGDPTYNGPSGFDGAFQFSPATWNSMGTGYAFAYEAPFDVQLDAAKRLIARSGWGQFPACSRKLGMR